MLNRNDIHHWSEPGNISAPNSANSVVRWAPPLLSMEKGKIKMINKILGHARGGHLRVALGVVSGALRGEGDWRVVPCQCGTGGWVVPVYQLPSTWNLSSIALLHSHSAFAKGHNSKKYFSSFGHFLHIWTFMICYMWLKSLLDINLGIFWKKYFFQVTKLNFLRLAPIDNHMKK